MISALVVAHGLLGQALQDTLSGILGPLEGFRTISNEGLSAVDLEARVSDVLDEMGENTFLFTDYFGGSCASACLENARRRKSLPVVSGVNLPMLLYFLSHREDMESRELLKGLLNRGQNAIRELEPPSL